MESKSLDFLGFPSYTIDTLGRVYSITLKDYLKPSDKGNGYLTVMLQHNGEKLSIGIHVLVAKAFIPNPFNYNTVDHIDFDKSNNRVENLQWLSKEENSKRSWLEGRHDKQKKVVLQIDNSGNIISEHESIQAAATFVGVDRSCISRACSLNRKSKGFYWKFK